MAKSPFDPMQADEELDAAALMAQLGDKSNAAQVDAPTSNTMPVGTPRNVTPAATPASRRTGAPPAGFDATNWADPNMDSVKYDAGAFLNGATRPSEVAAIVTSEDFQRRFPGATYDGKDRVNFQGGQGETVIRDGGAELPIGLH